MKKAVLFTVFLLPIFLRAQIITTVAGNGIEGYSNSGGAATAAELDHPYSIALDGSGNLYISNFVGCTIEKVNTSGIITVIAGDTVARGYSGDGGPATAALIKNPWGIAVDALGNIYFADAGNNRIRKISPSGNISTIAGNGMAGDSGDGGSATAASIGVTNGLTNPDEISIAIDGSGNIYFSDFWGNIVRKIDTLGIINRVAGTGTVGFSGDGGQATDAKLQLPEGIAVDGQGNLYICDYENYRIRKVASTGIISTIGGTGVYGYSGDGGQATSAKFNFPSGIAIDVSGAIYVSDLANNRIRKISTGGIITTIAGNGIANESGDGGAATSAELSYPESVAVSASGNVYFTDVNRVRKVGCEAFPPISGANSVCAGGTHPTLANAITGGSWTSGAPSVATITSAGMLYGLTAGTAIITYTKFGCSVTQVVTVDASPLTNNTGTMAVCTGNTTTLLNSTAGGTWSSNNTLLATVNSTTGVITGVAAGSPIISYMIGAGCYKTSTVSVGAPLTTPITGTTEICAGGTHPTLANATTGGSWTSGSTAVATITSAGMVSGLTAGTTTITYTKSGCTTTQAVTVDASPLTNNTGTMVVCAGNTITLLNSTSGGTWSSSNTLLATVNSSTGVVTGVAAGSPMISYMIGAGCYKTSTVSIGTPITTPITGTTEICADGTHPTLANATTGGSWTSSNTAVATVTSSGIVSGLTAGTTMITYTKSGCTITQIVTVDASPLSNNTGTMSVCTGNTTTLLNSTAGGVWSSNNTVLATVDGTTGVVTGVATGSPMISYMIGAGCYKTSTVSVGAPLATPITGTTEICAGGTHPTLANATTGGSWTSGSTAVATITSAGMVSGLTAGTTTITYTKSGCTATQVVTVDASPLTNNTGTMVVCTGNTITLLNSTSGGTWSSNNTLLATVNSSTGVVTGVAAGSPMISYMIGAGCYKTSTVSVGVPLTTPITGTTEICAGGTHPTMANATAGGSWASSNTAVATVTSSGMVSGLTAGNTTISYTKSGCAVTQIVTVDANPLSNSSGINSVCLGNTTTLSNSTPGGVWSSGNVLMATVDGTTGVVTGIGAGSPMITYMTGTGCFKAALVGVGAPITTPITGTTEICAGGTHPTMTNATTGGIWSSSNSSVALIGSTTGMVSGLTAGNTTISYTKSGCTTTQIVTVDASPLSNNTGSNTICTGNTTTLLNSTSGGIWSSNNTLLATVNSSTGIVTGVAAGSPIISYMIGAGCYKTTSVTVHTPPTSVSGNSSICTSTPLLFTNGTVGGTWSSSAVSKATVGSTTGLVTGVAAGTSIISYSISGCAPATLPITVSACRETDGGSGNDQSVVTTNEIITYSLFPNPTKGTIYIIQSQISDMAAEVYLINNLGQKVYSGKIEFSGGYGSVNLDGSVQSGVYLLEIKGADEKSHTSRLVIER